MGDDSPCLPRLGRAASDTGVSSHTDSSGRRTPVRQAQTTGVSHGTSNDGYVTAFTRGNDLPRNAPSSIQLFVYKRTTSLFFFCRRKAEIVCLRAARLSSPCLKAGAFRRDLVNN